MRISEKVAAHLRQRIRKDQAEESSRELGGTSATASDPRLGDRTMFGVDDPLQSQT